MNKLKKILLNAGSSAAYGIISVIFMFVPEDVFKIGVVQCDWSDSAIIVANRIVLSVAVLTIANIIYYYWYKHRRSVTIDDNKSSIKVDYGDITKIADGKKIINFDECFTTTVGDRPQDIKPGSVCGQYLAAHSIGNMQGLIHVSGLKPVGQSQYNNLPRYESGILIPKDDFLLMAFAKLDRNGLGKMTYAQYLDCLSTLWQQIDLYHGTEDVFVPILGSKIVRFVDRDLNQQELLDIMIASYRLSPNKMKRPFTLHIVCAEREGFSINNVFGVR
jgi:hypothetical protein